MLTFSWLKYNKVMDNIMKVKPLTLVRYNINGYLVRTHSSSDYSNFLHWSKNVKNLCRFLLSWISKAVAYAE